MPVVEPVVALRGDEGNPVYKWHNDFVSVRQAGRSQLQAALYSRAQGRAGVRTDPSAAAGLSTTLFGVLNLTQGRMPTYGTGAWRRWQTGGSRTGGPGPVHARGEGQPRVFIHSAL